MRLNMKLFWEKTNPKEFNYLHLMPQIFAYMVNFRTSGKLIEYEVENRGEGAGRTKSISSQVKILKQSFKYAVI